MKKFCNTIQIIKTIIVRNIDPCERNPCEGRSRCVPMEEENKFECIGNNDKYSPSIDLTKLFLVRNLTEKYIFMHQILGKDEVSYGCWWDDAQRTLTNLERDIDKSFGINYLQRTDPLKHCKDAA